MASYLRELLLQLARPARWLAKRKCRRAIYWLWLPAWGFVLTKIYQPLKMRERRRQA